jgi:flagellar protein FliO/FliZ
MNRRSGRWLGTAIAVLVVAALAIYALTAGADRAPTAGGSSTPETQVPGLSRAPGAEAHGQSAGATVVGVRDLVGLALKTGIVVALLGASLWALRRYAGAVPARRGSGAVTVAETVPLAQGRAVYVLDVGDRALLVGATPQQLTLLGEVRDTAVLARLRAAPSHPAPSLTGLVARLRAVLAAARGAAHPAGTPHAWIDGLVSPGASDFAATLARLEDPVPGLEPQDRLAAFAARVRAPRAPR